METSPRRRRGRDVMRVREPAAPRRRFRPTRIAQSIALVVVSGCFACAFLYKFDKPDAHYREERAREEAEWQAEHKGETYE